MAMTAWPSVVAPKSRKFEILPYGLFVALRVAEVREQGAHMPTLPKAEPQAKPITETSDVHKKKQELEERIKKVDSLHDLLAENAAQRDIEAYKTNKRERGG
jgi:hypothetical protein